MPKYKQNFASGYGRKKETDDALLEPLPLNVQEALQGMKTPFSAELPPVWHGQTGTTYGGVAYTPLFRSITFPSHGARSSAGHGVHLRDGKGIRS